MDLTHKANLAYYTGSTVIEKENRDSLMEKLESYPGMYYADIEVNGFVLVEKV